jgi:hypothetical protein
MQRDSARELVNRSGDVVAPSVEELLQIRFPKATARSGVAKLFGDDSHDALYAYGLFGVGSRQ